jgi:hypothetical protein
MALMRPAQPAARACWRAARQPAAAGARMPCALSWPGLPWPQCAAMQRSRARVGSTHTLRRSAWRLPAAPGATAQPADPPSSEFPPGDWAPGSWAAHGRPASPWPHLTPWQPTSVSTPARAPHRVGAGQGGAGAMPAAPWASGSPAAPWLPGPGCSLCCLPRPPVCLTPLARPTCRLLLGFSNIMILWTLPKVVNSACSDSRGGPRGICGRERRRWHCQMPADAAGMGVRGAPCACWPVGSLL